ncbi:MAG: hypothetical protein INQ03_05000 [Candidatus Heimdallarchaeota archaeon]|nr:hypothetical protein [Candidatus Heimdallarchaeota archaeon]
MNENIETQIWETLDKIAEKYKSDFERSLCELWEAILLAANQKKKYFSHLLIKIRKSIEEFFTGKI